MKETLETHTATKMGMTIKSGRTLKTPPKSHKDSGLGKKTIKNRPLHLNTADVNDESHPAQPWKNGRRASFRLTHADDIEPSPSTHNNQESTAGIQEDNRGPSSSQIATKDPDLDTSDGSNGFLANLYRTQAQTLCRSCM